MTARCSAVDALAQAFSTLITGTRPSGRSRSIELAPDAVLALDRALHRVAHHHGADVGGLDAGVGERRADRLGGQFGQ